VIKNVRGICCWLALFLVSVSSLVFGQGEPIHYDSGYTWRGYTGSIPPVCTSKLCHYQPFYKWDSLYKEFTSWRSVTGDPNSARIFINFRVLFPPGYNMNDATTKYPLVVVMHGAGESGRIWTDHYSYEPSDTLYDNNSRQTRYGGNEHASAAAKPASDARSCRAIVVFPQASYSASWSDLSNMSVISEQEEMLMGFLETQLIGKYHADPNRVVAVGLSSGGREIWALATKRPDFFAGIIAMSAVSANYEATSEAVKALPIWIFQGGIDVNPTKAAGDAFVAALRAKGNNPRYTIYPNTGHATWYNAYREPDIFSWIMGIDQRNFVIAGSSTTICAEPVTLTALAGMAAYQWTRNGEDLTGQIAKDVTVGTEGTYAVKFQRPSGDWDQSNSIQLTQSSDPACVVAGVDDATEAVAFPNPTTDFVNVRTGQKTEPEDVQVISSTGQFMNAGVESVSDSEVVVDLRNAGPGMYVIRLRTTGKRFVVIRK
jgi:predicted esterase